MDRELTRSRTSMVMGWALLACSVWAFPADAQQLQWNRKIKGLAVTPTPGAPDGVYDLYAEWVVRGRDAAPQSVPQNLGTLIHILVNGSVLSIVTVPAQVDPGSGLCFDCEGECSGLSCGGMNNGQDELNCIYDADCSDPGIICECPDGGPEIDCVCEGTPDPCLPDCVPDLPLATALQMNVGDEITVILYPAPGALPDPETDDDSREAVLADGAGVFWNRRVESIDVQPSSAGGGSFFDVFCRVETATHSIDYMVDLSAVAEVQINGVPVHTQQINRYHSPTSCGGANPPPGGDCSLATGCGTVSSGGGSAAGLECATECLGSGAFSCFCQCQAGDLITVPNVGPLQPGDEITVILYPAPGAMPDLPGLPEDNAGSVVIGECASTADCADLDGDGVRDSNCIWWECGAASTCNATFIPFADMGGAFGACPPDFTADANDRYHALNCFSNEDTTGEAEYPCEESPPQAMNVDAGGAFGSCSPDGVCDGNDAFAALNAFGGTTTCSCAMGPAPGGAGGGPRVLEQAGLILVPSREVVAPGDVVDVDVYLASALSDLRGYQLHVDVSGGSRGTLQLVDMSIHQTSPFTKSVTSRSVLGPRSSAQSSANVVSSRREAQAEAEQSRNEVDPLDSAGSKPRPSALEGTWSAFNVTTGQMVAGVDGPGVAAAPLSYLATFTFVAGDEARGTFIINVMYDDSDPSQRTFLFPTAPDGKIAIHDVAPAVITVGQRTADRKR